MDYNFACNSIYTPSLTQTFLILSFYPISHTLSLSLLQIHLSLSLSPSLLSDLVFFIQIFDQIRHYGLLRERDPHQSDICGLTGGYRRTSSFSGFRSNTSALTIRRRGSYLSTSELHASSFLFSSSKIRPIAPLGVY